MTRISEDQVRRKFRRTTALDRGDNCSQLADVRRRSRERGKKVEEAPQTGRGSLGGDNPLDSFRISPGNLSRRSKVSNYSPFGRPLSDWKLPISKRASNGESRASPATLALGARAIRYETNRRRGKTGESFSVSAGNWHRSRRNFGRSPNDALPGEIFGRPARGRPT